MPFRTLLNTCIRPLNYGAIVLLPVREGKAIYVAMHLAILGFGCLAGVLSHAAIFIRGEWDKHAPFLFHYFITAPGLLTCSCLTAGWYSTAILLVRIWLCYVSSICLSIAVYRLSLHPLKRFPGKLLAKLSTLRWIKAAAVDRKWHLEVQKMHNTYGDFVRISMFLLALRH